MGGWKTNPDRNKKDKSTWENQNFRPSLKKNKKKKVEYWKAHWRILGNSICACAAQRSLCRFCGKKKKNQTRKLLKKGNKAGICREKCFTWNEKQIFEQMEKFLCCSSCCAEKPQLHKHSTKGLIWIIPFRPLSKVHRLLEERDVQERKRRRQEMRGSEIEKI